MKVKAKFEVVSVTQYPQRKWDDEKHVSVPDGVSLEVRAQAAQGEGNKAWAAASPSGELRIVVSKADGLPRRPQAVPEVVMEMLVLQIILAGVEQLPNLIAAIEASDRKSVV